MYLLNFHQTKRRVTFFFNVIYTSASRFSQLTMPAKELSKVNVKKIKESTADTLRIIIILSIIFLFDLSVYVLTLSG